MAAGQAMLTYLRSHPEVYQQINKATDKLVSGLKKQWADAGFNFTINQVGSMFTLFFTSSPVNDLTTAKTSDTQQFGRYFQAMLENGVYLAPSQYEAMFISTAITEDIVTKILDANSKAVAGT
jgi:glutamate-1-semialdehyde 2,1-aminomutase